MEKEARWLKQWLVQWTPILGHCIVFVLSWCLLTQMYKYYNGYWLQNSGGKAQQR